MGVSCCFFFKLSPRFISNWLHNFERQESNYNSLIDFVFFFFFLVIRFFSFLFFFLSSRCRFQLVGRLHPTAKKKIIRFHCMLIFSNYFLKKTFGTARGFGTGKSIGPRYATPTILIFFGPKLTNFGFFVVFF